jgi:hypothetical protein
MGGSFDLRSENRATKVGSMFMGASFPMLSHGFFLKQTRLQRFFCRLPIHFFHCLGFKLGGFFPRLFRLLFIGCVSCFLGCLVLFVPRLTPRVPKLFLKLTLFSSLHVVSLRHLGLGCLGFILNYLGFFISCMGSHAFS